MTQKLSYYPGVTKLFAIQSVIRPNDEIIVFDPAYDAYDPQLVGG